MAGSGRVLTMSTLAFTLLFAVWLQFGILQDPIAREFGLTTTQIAWLIAVPALNGSLWRLLTGIMADWWGGRVTMAGLMLLTAVPTFGVVFADADAGRGFWYLLLFAFGIGLAGNSFTIGTAWNSAWFPPGRQGLALGVFGAGNVGASVTKLVAPGLLAAIPAVGWLAAVGLDNWRLVPVCYSLLLVAAAAAVWVITPREDRKPSAGIPLRKMLRPLRELRVWRFSLYYVVVFGAYVALSGWMPKFYTAVFDVPLALAGLLTSLFIFPASLLRPLGGWLADRFGARGVLWASFAIMAISSAAMCFGLDLAWFTVALVALGVGMGVGKAAVYKHVAAYYPADVGAVGGLVGCLGGLGAVVLPLAFAYLDEWTAWGIQVSTFGTMTALVIVTTAWMGAVIYRMARKDKNTEDLVTKGLAQEYSPVQ
ncbi:MAG: MFS transporter [Propionibacteriaceae bacterium]|jgi:NNP family nitrate/nitrite transporter-like MFS transporter|nr:MFS transporter [Propionibacteriaceae bacterium]